MSPSVQDDRLLNLLTIPAAAWASIVGSLGAESRLALWQTGHEGRRVVLSHSSHVWLRCHQHGLNAKALELLLVGWC